MGVYGFRFLCIFVPKQAGMLRRRLKFFDMLERVNHERDERIKNEYKRKKRIRAYGGCLGSQRRRRT